MSNEEFSLFVQRIGRVRGWAPDTLVQHELKARLILALIAFKEGADESATRLAWLTLALVGLTLVLVFFAIRAG